MAWRGGEVPLTLEDLVGLSEGESLLVSKVDGDPVVLPEPEGIETGCLLSLLEPPGTVDRFVWSEDQAVVKDGEEDPVAVLEVGHKLVAPDDLVVVRCLGHRACCWSCLNYSRGEGEGSEDGREELHGIARKERKTGEADRVGERGSPSLIYAMNPFLEEY